MKRLARLLPVVFWFAVARAAVADPAAASSTAASEGAVASPAVPHQETVEARAERFFREGRELLKQGKYEAACPQLEESQKLDPALGTLLNLAVCYEEWGKVASAWRVYRLVASQARERAQFEREALAQERIVELEPQLPRIVLEFQGSLPTSVSLNDQPLPSAAWGRPLLVDPGSHHLEVRVAPNGLWNRQVAVQRGQALRITVPAMKPRAPATSAAPRSGSKRDSGPSNGQRTAALVVGGVGVGSAIVGTVFGILAYSTHASSEDECGAKGACTLEGRNLREDALEQAAVSTVAFSVAAASVGGALALWFTAPKQSPRSGSVRFRASASPAHLELGTGVDF